MDRYEFRDEVKRLYTSRKKCPELVDIPQMNYVMFDGTGHPEEQDFQIACEAVYTISYIIKFEIARKKLDLDYKVSYLEVKWDLNQSEDKTLFTWTMMILQPISLTTQHLMKRCELHGIRAKKLSIAVCDLDKAVQAGQYRRFIWAIIIT